MNKELYERLTEELKNLIGMDKTPSKVRELLSSELSSKGTSWENILAVTSAFYEYTMDNSNMEPLADYCKNLFSSYFTAEKLRELEMRALTESEKELFEKAATIVGESLKEKLNRILLIDKFSFKKEEINLDNNENESLTSDQKGLILDEKIDAISDKLNVSADTLIDKMDIEGIDPHKIDDFKIDEDVLAFARQELATSLSKNRFMKFLSNVKKGSAEQNFFKNVNMKLVELNNKMVLKLERTDKIASADKLVIDNIITSAKKKRMSSMFSNTIDRFKKISFKKSKNIENIDKAVLNNVEEPINEITSKQIPTEYTDVYSNSILDGINTRNVELPERAESLITEHAEPVIALPPHKDQKPEYYDRVIVYEERLKYLNELLENERDLKTREEIVAEINAKEKELENVKNMINSLNEENISNVVQFPTQEVTKEALKVTPVKVPTTEAYINDRLVKIRAVGGTKAGQIKNKELGRKIM